MAETEAERSLKKVRTGKSCLVCRQKKIKCDLLKPFCGGCVKRGRSHLCVYDEQKWTLKDERPKHKHNGDSGSIHIKTSKYQLLLDKEKLPTNIAKSPLADSPPSDGSSPRNNLMPNFSVNKFITSHRSQRKFELDHPLDNNSIDFYSNAFPSPVSLTQGALSWVSLLRKDIYLNMIGISSQRARSLVSKSDIKMTQRKVDAKYWERLRHSHVQENRNEEMIDMVSKIELELADGKLVWLLIDRFFNSELALYLPFLDQGEFIRSLTPLIGEKTHDKITVTLNKSTDITTIGILLLIMRITSLSMYNFGKEENSTLDPDTEYLLKFEISTDVVPLINKIHSEVLKFKTPKLNIFQFLLLKINYDVIAPESCDCVTYSNSSNIGELFQYGIHCSLNRDPTTANVNIYERNKNLLRRLWYEVVHIDSLQMILIGNPTIVDHKFYDTHFPHLDECENENEHIINKWFYERAEFYDACYPLLTLILEIRDKPKIGIVKLYLDPLLKYLSKLKTLTEIMNSSSATERDRCDKLKHFHLMTDGNAILYMIYYHFYLFYNENNDKESSLHYLLKLIEVSTVLYEAILFLDPRATEYDLQKHFGCGVLVFPKIELSLHRITQLLFGLLIRIKGLKMLAGDVGISHVVAELVDKIFHVSKRSLKHIFSSFNRVSEKYYHPWVTSKVEIFILANIAEIPTGTHFGPITSPVDKKFMENLARSQSHDDMFGRYDKYDLLKILQSFDGFEKILDKLNHSTNGLIIDSEMDGDVSFWDQRLFSAHDKKWLEQMVQGFLDADETIEVGVLEESTNEIPSRQTGVSLDDFASIEDLNELINANMDIFDFEKLFYYGGAPFGSI